MRKILLIVPDTRLRQLYHEKLLSSELEIVPAEDLASALLLFTIMQFAIVVFYVDTVEEAEIFLKLRLQQQRFITTKFIILSNTESLRSLSMKTDIVLSPLQLPFKEIVKRVKDSI